jgi:Flp pilus assembly pilin Flp
MASRLHCATIVFERPAPGVARAITGRQDSPRKEDRSMGNLIKRLVHEESAQTAAEYALLLALIIIIALVSVKLLGTNLNSQLQNIAKNLS